MANPFASTDYVDGRQLFALHTCIDYLCEMHPGKISVGDIQRGSELNRDAYSNLWRAKRPTSADAAAIYKYINDFLSHTDLPIDSWIRPTFHFMFPDLPQFFDYANIFAECAEPTPDERLFNTYLGVYAVYRYASHINTPPDMPPQKDTPILIEQERNNIDARVVRAAMRVYRSSEKWPLFEIRYQPRETRQVSRLISINGMVVPIRDHIYFAGIEENFRTPMIIAAQRQYGINMVEGIVLRKHEKGRILASRVVLIKRNDEISFEDECTKIGIFKESDLNELNSSIKDLMYNDVIQYGKGNLLL